MRVAAAADGGEPCPPFGHVSPADLAQTGERRLRTRHQSRRRREGPAAAATAIPMGHARARTQYGWLDDVAQHPAMLARRADTRERILQLAQRLAAHAVWRQAGVPRWQWMTTRPTWEALQRETGLSRSTVAAHLAWLQKVGLLGLVAHGTTPDLSPGILADPDNPGRNEAAVYVLMAPTHLRLVAVPHPDDVGAEYVHDGRDCDPDDLDDWTLTNPTTGQTLVLDPLTGELHDPTADRPTTTPAPRDPREDAPPPHPHDAVDQTRTPTSPRRGHVTPSYARESETPSGAGLRPARQSLLSRDKEPPRNIPDLPAGTLTAKPAGTKSGRMIAALALQCALPVLWRISTAHVAHLTREWWLAGWTPAEVITAIGRRPDHTPWRHDQDIRHVPGWLRHRLAAWRHDPTDPTSPVRRPPREAAALHAAAQARARTERRAAETATRATATTAVQVKGWAEARADLAARRAAARRARQDPPA